MGYSVHQRPGDPRCLIPHLKEIQERFDVQPEKLIGDSAYGSEENYAYLKAQNIESYVKYGMYEKEQTRKFQKNPHHQQNWAYDKEQDVFLCAAGKHLEFVKEVKKRTESGYESIVRKYQCWECEGCPFREACTTSKVGRSTEWNPTYQQYKREAKEKLGTQEGKKRYSQRKIDIESVFGQIKHNRGFRRFVLRGLQKIHIEWGLLCVAHNLLKKASTDQKIEKKEIHS